VFSTFFLDMQQNVKLFLFFPVLCAVFRAIFIRRYCPYPTLSGRWPVVWHCFRYGFWWGMDFNAYVFLLPLVFVTLPGLYFDWWLAHGDYIRIIAAMAYAIVLYGVFAGKMLFYFHFHDIFNHIVRLGRHAEKHNLADIFFHEDHGLAILLGYIPYLAICFASLYGLLQLPSIPYPTISSSWVSWIFSVVTVLAIALVFYFFRYGGTLIHDNKPEWDTIPSIVKKDIFFAKATVDDLVALEQVWKHPLKEAYTHTDEEDLSSLSAVVPQPDISLSELPNPVYAFSRTTKGPHIAKPSHIFLIVGESYLQQLFDPTFACLHVAEGGKAIMEDSHTAWLAQTLSAGIISRPSIVSLMTGIFDAGLELNEQETFWQGTVPSALPVQLKKLGYASTYWYGGNVTYGNFNQFAPACGFDRVMTATDFCGPQAPKTWVGVYDHLFLEKAAELIKADPQDGPSFHYVYTTSNHGPFKINLQEYGFDTEQVMPDAPEDIRKNKDIQKMLGTFWYSDQAISKFIREMKQAYPDSLFIITGDHAINLSMLNKTSLMNRECSLRERSAPVFMFHHRDITPQLFGNNTIGGHMNIMPTILEMIAPAGFSYYSIVPSLFEPVDHVVTPDYWLTPDRVGEYKNEAFQLLENLQQPGEIQHGTPLYREERAAWGNLTGYLVRHPELLEPAADLIQRQH
jgi:lipoteichoic acid synthase